MRGFLISLIAIILPVRRSVLRYKGNDVGEIMKNPDTRKNRTFKASDEEWEALKRLAERNETTISRTLRALGEQEGRKK